MLGNPPYFPVQFLGVIIIEMNRDGVIFVLKAEEPMEQEKPPSAEDTAKWEYIKKADERSGKLKGTQASELDVAQWVYGEPLKVAGLKGSVLVLHFWTSDTSRDEKTIGFINMLQKVYGDKGVMFIGIAKPSGELDKLREYIKRNVEYTTAIDKQTDIPGASGVTFDKYAIFHTPTFVVIDKDGVIRDIVPDFLLEERIQEFLR